MQCRAAEHHGGDRARRPAAQGRCLRPSGGEGDARRLSAGGLSSLLAADAPGVVGFVGLDPFDRTLADEGKRLGLAAASRLQTEALLLFAPPSRCNADAVGALWSTVLPALWRDESIGEASHCDFESPTDWLCRLACGNSDPARQQRVRERLLEAAAHWMR